MGDTAVEETVRNAVVSLFLETGRDATIREIATRLQCSESKVRKTLVPASGFVLDGLCRSEEQRDNHSANYSYMTAGTHKVSVYGPTRVLLRSIIKGMAPATVTVAREG